MKRIIPLILALSLLCTACANFMAATQQAENQIVPPVVVEEPQPEPEDNSFNLAYDPNASFHPYDCLDFSNRAILSLIYESLFVVDSNFKAIPQLADTYTASSDGLSHIVTLKPDQTFSDGSKVTAHDVVASLTAADQAAYYSNRLYLFTDLTATDDTTITMTTSTAVEQVPQLLNIPIVKAETLDDDYPLGSGDYTMNLASKILSATADSQTNLPQYIGLVSMSSAEDLRESFSFGEIDLVYTDPNGGTKTPYMTDYELWSSPTTILQYVGYQTTGGIFSNQTLRQAMTYAFDRQTLAEQWAGNFALATTLPISPFAPGYDPVLAAEYEYDWSHFTQLLEDMDLVDWDEDGILEYYTDTGTAPVKVTFIAPTGSHQRVNTAEAMAETMTKAGFSVDLQLLSPSEYQYAIKNGKYDMYLGEAKLSPNFDLSPFFTTGGSLSYGGISQETLSYLCTQMLENSGNAYNLHQAILDGGWLCPILVKTYAAYATRGKYSGFAPVLDNPFVEVN